MAPLPPIRDRTLLLCDRRLEEIEMAAPERPYLGMSGIGEECARQLWYRFRWCKRIPFDARTLKKFRDGHISEQTVVRQLQQCDWLDVIAHDEHGAQREYLDFAGHFLGHQDGEISGIVEAPKTPHCLEVKATSKIEDLKLAIVEHGEKDALRHWWPTYYAQAQCYMGYGGYTRHFLVACSPGAREWISVRTDFNKDVFNGLRARAEYIIFSERPPTRVCPKVDFFKVKFCDYAPACFGDPAANPRHCRTCMHVTPTREGEWTCAKRGLTLTERQQRTGCVHHRFHPDLMHDREPVSADEAGNITYKLADGQWTDLGQ